MKPDERALMLAIFQATRGGQFAYVREIVNRIGALPHKYHLPRIAMKGGQG